MALVVKCNNGIVTDAYLELIGSALCACGHTVAYTNDFSDALELDKSEIVVVARTVEAFRLIVKGYKKVIMWFQGIDPEESYMKHKSKLRYAVLSFIEKTILKKSWFNLFVSSEMLRHYQRKYKLQILDDSYYVMPCQNTQLHPEAFDPEDKYKKNIFVYTGSMAVWQKFEDTVKVYKEIENSGLKNCEFWVFTGEKEKAEDILEKYQVKEYKIDFVKNTELPKALAQAKYGFIIREDTTVNRVATPTKISTYLSCGLIPIYSKCLAGFEDVATSMKYVVVYDEHYQTKIQEFDRNEISSKEILAEYEEIFSLYYNNELHKENLKSKISEKTA